MLVQANNKQIINVLCYWRFVQDNFRETLAVDSSQKGR